MFLFINKTKFNFLIDFIIFVIFIYAKQLYNFMINAKYNIARIELKP